MNESVVGNIVGSLIDRNRDENCWGGGGFIWVIMLMFLFSGGFAWGNHGNMATTQDVAGATAYNQIDNGIRSMERNQSNIGYNTLDQFNHLQHSIAESTFAVKNGMCEIGRNIDGVRYDITRNVDALRFDTANQTHAINAVSTANTQKILDRLCEMESNAKDSEISRLRFDLQAAQLALANGQQTKTIIGALTPPLPQPAYVVANPYAPVTA